MSNEKSTELTDAEVANEKALLADMKTYGGRLPEFYEHDDGTYGLNVKHTGTYSAMFGDTKSQVFAVAMANGCANISGRREANEADKNYALAIVAEIAPRDGIEAMLATQMAAVHMTAMRESRNLANSDTIDQFNAHERALNKLMRTFTAQMGALRKHRHGGKQTVTVQHVNVEDGGQAIVGNVAGRGEGNHGK